MLIGSEKLHHMFWCLLLVRVNRPFGKPPFSAKRVEPRFGHRPCPLVGLAWVPHGLSHWLCETLQQPELDRALMHLALLFGMRAHWFSMSPWGRIRSHRQGTWSVSKRFFGQCWPSSSTENPPLLGGLPGGRPNACSVTALITLAPSTDDIWESITQNHLYYTAVPEHTHTHTHKLPVAPFPAPCIKSMCTMFSQPNNNFTRLR